MLHKAINFVAFQLCWAACVLGAAGGFPMVGVAVVASWVAVHLVMLPQPGRGEPGLLACAAALGTAGDSALVMGGWMSFPAHAQLGAPTTLWMVALWVAFATTLNHSLAWMRDRLTLAAVGGAVAGPLAYWAGTRLGAVDLPRGEASIVAVAALWALATPALLVIRRQLARRAAPLETAS